MSTDIVFDAVEAYLRANWTTTPLRFENEATKRPVDEETGAVQAWVEVEIIGDQYDIASLGAGDPAEERWREEGDVLLFVLVPVGTGSRVARQHATALLELFRGVELDPDIEFQELRILGGARDADDRNFWRLSASAHFIRG